MSTREGELFVEKIEVSLDGRQIFCLFCGGAVIASLVFVLGVTVGRRVEAREHPEAVAATAAAADPLAALDQLAAEGAAAGPDLAFASTLRGERGADPLGPVDLSLDRAPPPGPETPAASRPVQNAMPAARSVEPARSAPASPAAGQMAPDAARFTLHLSSFQDRAQADQLVARLKRAGYQAYVVETLEADGTWYRVRVGRYASFEDAVAAKTEFEKKQNIIAYVTRTKK